jgi:hypothetical protein
MPTAFRAIKGKKLKLPQRVFPQARQIMVEFQRKGLFDASVYPVQLPPKTPGARPYKRTNSLARSWSAKSGVTGTKSITARIISSPAIAPYNILVVGPVFGPKGKRQTQEMKRRNWESAPRVLERLWESMALPRLETLLRNG